MCRQAANLPGFLHVRGSHREPSGGSVPPLRLELSQIGFSGRSRSGIASLCQRLAVETLHIMAYTIYNALAFGNHPYALRCYQRSQIKAATAVNSEMLCFYWSLGRDIVAMDAENTYGSNFYKTLSADLRAALPNAKGFSVSNLKYMRRFYELYNRQQVADDLALEKAEEIRQQVADELVVVRSSVVFQIPWGHHCLLLDKCNSDIAMF